MASGGEQRHEAAAEAICDAIRARPGVGNRIVVNFDRNGPLAGSFDTDGELFERHYPIRGLEHPPEDVFIIG